MTPELHRLLLSVDDPTGCEFPTQSTVTYAEMDARVRGLQEALRTELSHSFQRDGQVQDASFFDDLFIHEQESTNSRYLLSRITIRLSNFGNLATVTTALDRIPPEYDVPRITEIMQRHGWTVVDAEKLSAIYDGPNEVLRDGKTTWWIRYFDYL